MVARHNLVTVGNSDYRISREKRMHDSKALNATLNVRCLTTQHPDLAARGGSK